jgi:hypothetical protein
MKSKNKKHALSLSGKLSLATLALAAMAPLPAALGPFSVISEAHAQSNPCAPTPPKSRPANPCAPQKARPANPCAPKPAHKAGTAEKAKKNCDAPKNPCAPAPKCTEDGQG